MLLNYPISELLYLEDNLIPIFRQKIQNTNFTILVCIIYIYVLLYILLFSHC